MYTRSLPLVSMTSGSPSVVPRKFLVGSVPVFPAKSHVVDMAILTPPFSRWRSPGSHRVSRSPTPKRIEQAHTFQGYRTNTQYRWRIRLSRAKWAKSAIQTLGGSPEGLEGAEGSR